LTKKRIGLIVAAGWAALCLSAQEKPKPSGIFSLYVENDVFAGTDRGYTNGFRFVWVSLDLNAERDQVRPPRWLDRLSRMLPLVQPPDARRFMSLSFGQNIYTPDDITRSDLIPDDRPYAGISYAALGFHAQDRSSMDTVELYAGIVGPSSLAGWTQYTLHKFFGWTYPQGWARQLHDEPVLGLVYDHKWKLDMTRESRSLGWDLIGHGGAELSNMWTGLRSGIELRGGWNLPRDFGTSFIQPGSDSASLFEERDIRLKGRELFGFHLFLALEGQWVARNLFLDGNTFRSSHHVEKEPFLAGAAAGFALRYKRLRFSFSYVAKTKEFTTQRKKSLFGSLNISFTLRH
jgi:lipid A 3-O-deacylase